MVLDLGRIILFFHTVAKSASQIDVRLCVHTKNLVKRSRPVQDYTSHLGGRNPHHWPRVDTTFFTGLGSIPHNVGSSQCPESQSLTS